MNNLTFKTCSSGPYVTLKIMFYKHIYVLYLLCLQTLVFLDTIDTVLLFAQF